MLNLTFIVDHAPCLVQAPSGRTVRDIAVANDVPGVPGECGGMMACGTCHVHVPAEWRARLPAAQDEERDLLELVSTTDEGSRLACQIVLTPALDGLVLIVPPRH